MQGLIFIVKGSNPSDQLAKIILQYPPDGIAVVKAIIFPGIEDIFNFDVKRTGPV